MRLRKDGMQGRILLSELVEIARNPEHVCVERDKRALRDLALLQPNNTIHTNVRSILLNSAVGDGLDLRFTNPIKEETT